MSFVSEFNKYYKDKLKPYGFIKLKGIPYFGRIINDEIIQTISFNNMNSLVKGKKAFALNFSVLSLYSSDLGKNYLAFASVPLVQLCDPSENNFWKIFDEYYSVYYDDNSINFALERSFKQVQDKLLPYINEIKSLENYIEHCKYMKIVLIRKDFNNYRDLYLLVKTNNHEDFSDLIDAYKERLLKNPNINPTHDYSEKINEYQKSLYRQIVEPRDEIYADSELYAQAAAEIENRKIDNIEALKAYGFKL